MNTDQRNRLILVLLATAAALALCYTVGISWFSARIQLESSRLEAIERRLQEHKMLVEQANAMGDEAVHRALLLDQLHQRMPAGDVYFSLLARLEPLGRAHGIRDVKLARPTSSTLAISSELAKLGYVGIRGALQAVGDYVQIGSFVAAVENELPFMRLNELRLDVVGARILALEAPISPLGFQMGFEGCATNVVLQ